MGITGEPSQVWVGLRVEGLEGGMVGPSLWAMIIMG
jgi:hypothetical protein